MKVQLLVFLVVAFALTINGTHSETFTRKLRWTRFQEMLDYGWIEQTANRTKTYMIPSGMDPKLYDLNKNFTDEVWGWKGMSNILSLNIGSKAEYCGMTSASLNYKYYLEATSSSRSSYIHPGCTYDSNSMTYRCFLGNSPLGTWVNTTTTLSIGSSRTIQITAGLAASGYFLLDEVTLTYTVNQGLNCPYSCNHDCAYVGIDCHNYYSCIDRRYKEFYSCPEDQGLAFNPSTGSCDLIENVHGCEPPPPPPEKCVCEYRPHETNCRKYYYCADTCHPEECVEKQCPSGLVWNIDSYGDGSGHPQCTLPGNSTCNGDEGSTTTEPPTTIEEESTTIEEESTTIEEEPTTIEEGSTTIEEEPTTIEEQPTTIEEESTTTEGSTTIEEESTTTDRGSTATEEESTTIEEELTTPEDNLTSTDEPALEFSCNDKVNGSYRNAESCHKYWKCSNGTALLYDCPEGYVFNPDLGRCDFSAEAFRYCKDYYF